MAKKVLHQLLDNVSRGDATSDHAFLIRNWLREFGFESHIYATTFQEGLDHEVSHFSPDVFADQELVIYHHTIGSANLQQLIEQQTRILLIYHNITPPKFFQTADPALTRLLVLGREQLRELQPFVPLALGASPYSQIELQEIGYEHTGVLPIILNEPDYDLPLDKELYKRIKNNYPTLLFVGRLAPNKCQEDLVKLHYYVRQLYPKAHLVLVGGNQGQEYVNWLRFFIDRYGMTDSVMITGKVSQKEMVTYYKSADLFVSMSEHEGFGKPLIESMYFGLPVMAYASSAVPSTLGDAGVLFTEKEFEPLSEMAAMLLQDQNLRQRVIGTQTRRVQAFLEPRVKQQFRNFLEKLNYFPLAS